MTFSTRVTLGIARLKMCRTRGGSRSRDHRITSVFKSPALYQLSYPGMCPVWCCGELATQQQLSHISCCNLRLCKRARWLVLWANRQLRGVAHAVSGGPASVTWLQRLQLMCDLLRWPPRNGLCRVVCHASMLVALQPLMSNFAAEASV